MKSKAFFQIIGLVSVLWFMISCSTENRMVYQNFALGKSKLLVCPVHILCNQDSRYDTAISKQIVDYINSKNYAVASPTQMLPVPNNEWRPNEAKMLSISIKLFVEFIKQNNLPENTYILYPEFLKAGQNDNVIAVHYCLLNNKGEIGMRGLLNSHWPEFQKVNPKNNADCLAVFINGFEGKMKK